MAISLWPSTSLTIFGFVPAASWRVANVWRLSRARDKRHYPDNPIIPTGHICAARRSVPLPREAPVEAG